MTDKNNKQSGIALLTAILFAGVLLAIAFTLSGIFLSKLRISAQSKNSVTAVYAAESALEWCLYEQNYGPGEPVPIMGNNSDFTDKDGGTFDTSDCLGGPPIKALGTFRGVTRAFEIYF